MIELPPLPYDYAALEPTISARTLHFHYDKHHASYVKKANKLLRAAGQEQKDDLVTLLRKVAKDPSQKSLFNNLAQVWNHNFYWQSLKPASARPKGQLKDLIDYSFGNFEDMKKKWVAEAMAQFGSGWIWLCREQNKLSLIRTANAETPISKNEVTPLLTIDVWEHAYYLDYQNRRQNHVADVIDHLLNWDFAAANNTGDAEMLMGKSV